MFVNIIKFIHILCVLGLLGSVFYNLVLACSKKIAGEHSTVLQLNRFNKIILWFSLFALFTGTLLVHPKLFTFHTPWIQAAYLLLILFCTGIYLIKKGLTQHRQSTRITHFVLPASYLILITILVFIIHDAVAKSTFIFNFL